MKCVVLDRDGTLIRYIPYLFEPLKVEVLPSVVEGLNRLVANGCTLFLHSNQSGVARGYFSLDDVIACNNEMLRQLGLGAGIFRDICICPDLPGDDESYRKPSPRFARDICAKYGTDSGSICYVGDNVDDLLTAQAIGCLGVGVSTGVPELRARVQQRGLTAKFPVYDSFAGAADRIVDYFRGTHD